MKKFISTFVLVVTLLFQATLVFIPAIPVASAAGNVTINDFTSSTTKGIVPLDARFTSDVTGEVTKWRWSFYNPQTGRSSFSIADKTTGITLGSAGAFGVFNVTLEVWGSEGNDSLKKIDYIVANKNTSGLPVANFSASVTSGDAPLKVDFTDSSTDANSSLWYFGLTNTSTDKNPSYTFTSPGIYRVVLEVSNDNGWDATAQDIIVQGQGKVLPIPNFDTNTSNGLTVQFTDTSQDGAGFSWDFGDGKYSTERNPVHNYSKTGNFIVSLAASNENGTNAISKIITVKDPSSSGDESDNGENSGDGGGDSEGSASVVDDSSSGGSSSGSSSGGGGSVGGSPEPQSNVETKEISQAYIENGNTVNFAFSQNVTPVMNINFDSKTTVGKTTTIVEMLKNQSSLVSEPPVDEIYKFINIWVGSGGVVTPDKIENAVVNFKVEKSWIQDKNIDKSSISLNRYSDDKWNVLSTNLSEEDDKFLYFTAQTPGYSPFAITGKTAGTSGTVNEAQSQNGTPKIEQNMANNTSNTEQTQKTGSSEKGSKAPGFEVFTGIISLLTGVLYKRK